MSLFSSAFFNGLYIIPVLAILILVHEFGHYFSARMCGVKVEEFGIGIPPRLFGWVRNGVIWSINAIPFGGFVRVKGEDGANQDPDSMNAKPPHQRAFFLAAGAGMNILFAVLLMFVVPACERVALATSSLLSTSSPFTSTIRSPGCHPAFEAGEPGATALM
jgi:regulator of sigma E protease